MRWMIGCVGLILWCSSATAYDPFSDDRIPPRFVIDAQENLRLVLKGNLVMSWRDLQGEGGDGFDSITDTATLGTRSGHVALDSARVGLRLETPVGMGVYSSFLFMQDNAALESAWFRWKHKISPTYTLSAEAGAHTPFVAIDPATLRWPLAARIYWGAPETHITALLNSQSSGLRWWVGLSASMMRPLETYSVNDAATKKGTLCVLGYGSAEAFSGNKPVGGAKLGVEVVGLTLELFGFLGRLAASRGTDELRNRMANYDLLKGFNSDEPRRQKNTFWWAGGRMAGQWSGFHVWLEAIESRESLLRRSLQLVQLGYIWTRTARAYAVFKAIEFWVRGERYRILDADSALDSTLALRVPDPSQAITWDWDILTFAMATQLYGDLVRLSIEYSVIAEHNGSAPLNRPDVSFTNNEAVVGLELRF